MKKLIAILLSVVSILSVCSLPAYAASGEQHADAALKNDRETVITITGEENIRKYLLDFRRARHEKKIGGHFSIFP